MKCLQGCRVLCPEAGLHGDVGRSVVGVGFADALSDDDFHSSHRCLSHCYGWVIVTLGLRVEGSGLPTRDYRHPLGAALEQPPVVVEDLRPVLRFRMPEWCLITQA